MPKLILKLSVYKVIRIHTALRQYFTVGKIKGIWFEIIRRIIERKGSSKWTLLRM